MPTHKPYHSYLIESLKDPAEAAAYLDAVLEDNDFEHFLLALKNVAEARRTLVASSHYPESTSELLQPESAWETCYQLLIQGKMPGFLAIAALLRELGLKLSITVQPEQAA